MRATMLLAGVAMGLLGRSAGAGITTTLTVNQGTGALAGNVICRFYAAFTTNSPEALAGATGLQSVKITIDTSAPMKFNFTALNAPLTQLDDADVYGQDSSADALNGPVDPRTDNSHVGTFARVGDSTGSPWNAVYLEGAPGPGVNLLGRNQTSASANPPVTAAEIMVNFATSKHLRLEGSMLGGADPSAKTNVPSTSAGSLFAVLVVPTGTFFTAQGLLAADHGGISGFSLGFTPEPGVLSLLGVGAVGLLGRRRRE